MNLTVYPGESLHGSLALPGDKSLSHRAALFAALADGQSRVQNFLVAGVTRSMLAALTSLGAAWRLDGDTLIVGSDSRHGPLPSSQGAGLRRLRSPDRPVDCGSSATTMRLLAGAVVASRVAAVLDGSPGLRRRPMTRIVAPLGQMGAAIESSAGCAPLTIRPSSQPLRPLDYSLPVASAQVKTCLLLAALSAQGATTLREPGPSRDHSERMLRSMGVAIHQELAPQSANPAQVITHLTPPAPLELKPLDLTLPGDISTAAFLIVAALITPGSQVSLPGVLLNPTRTGLLDALQAMGADLQIEARGERHGEPYGDLTVRSSRLQGTQVSGSLVVRMIDEFPAFAIAAACARGLTRVSQAQELRHKESDRITALCAELRLLGAQVDETPDGFAIEGRPPLEGGTVSAHGDHRLGMALAVAGLVSRKPVTVQGAEMIAESYPGFQAALAALGARCEMEA